MDKELEELLKVLENKDDEGIPTLDPILSFIARYNLKFGDEKVPSKILFKLFKMSYPDENFTRYHFSSELSKYLPYKQTSFLLNKSAMSINLDIFEAAPRKIVPTTSKPELTKVDRYLDYYSIKPGTLLVKLDILFYLYVLYTNETGIKRIMGKGRFSKILALKFEKKLLKNIAHYSVDQSIQNIITPEILQHYEEKTKEAKKRPYHPKGRRVKKNKI